MDELTVRQAVREAYGARAGACCDPEGSSGKLGVGNPIALAGLRPGEVVLDLGSGPGSDVLEAARRVGPQGKALGVDATPEMVYHAREQARSLDLGNAEFRLGEIEHLPVETATVDVVLSDCVVNLSPDKAQVFREAFRVLKPGGRLVLFDVIADGELPDAVRRDAAAWAACVAGAVPEGEYVSLLRDAGFEEVRAERRGPYAPHLHTVLVTAQKPLSA